MGHDMTATVENNSRDNYQIDYYKIYRTSNPNTTNESFSLISTVSAGEQNIFSDLQVENETRYYICFNIVISEVSIRLSLVITIYTPQFTVSTTRSHQSTIYYKHEVASLL